MGNLKNAYIKYFITTTRKNWLEQHLSATHKGLYKYTYNNYNENLIRIKFVPLTNKGISNKDIGMWSDDPVINKCENTISGQPFFNTKKDAVAYIENLNSFDTKKERKIAQLQEKELAIKELKK